MAPADPLARILDEAQAKQLPALIAEWSDVSDDRRWLARALRIDLALLTERPELVVPCLYRRCAFAGGDEEHGFYAKRTPIDLASLRALVRSFAARAARPWLRALRPPTVPIDGAVIEEYRTSIAGTLWCSDDGDRIGVAGDDAHVAWERSTGRRVDGARARAPEAEPPKSPPWEKSHRESTWGRLVLVRGEERIDLEIGDDQIIRNAHALTDDLVLVLGDELDVGDFYWLVDTRHSTIRWRHEGRIVTFALHGTDNIVVAHHHAITTHALATGDEIASFRLPYTGDLLLLPDGDLATRVGDVIRVWSVADANAAAQVVHTATSSWTPTAFSPDGERLVTGRMLCDATTGAFIAHLDCDSPIAWQEGGPPRGCQRLANGVFAEIMPFGLTLWDTRDGSVLLRDPERRGRISARARFDPTGRYHAIWNERGPLLVYRLREGTLLAELEPGAEPRGGSQFGFSPDGELLAWENAEGEHWAVTMGNPTVPYRIDDDPWEPPRVEIKPTDGVLVVGDAAIPYDDRIAIASPDGRSFAFLQSHFAIER